VFESRFRDRDPIASGGFGVVSKGIVEDDNGTKTEVAFKQFLPRGDFGLKCAASEANVLHSLKGQEKIVQLIAVVVKDDTIAGLVMEYVDGISLDIHLKNSELGWKDRLRTARIVAELFGFLHESCRVVHRDLKPGNIIITKTQKFVLCDFGLARHQWCGEDFVVTDHNGAGTTAYEAPEILMGQAPNHKIDVYAFGISIPQFFCGAAWKLSKRRKCSPKRADRVFPEFPPSHIFLDLSTLGCDCVEFSPKDRPEFKFIMKQLCDLENQHCP